MNISNRFLQKYYPTRKLYVWALALIYIAPISLLAAQQKKPNLDVLTIKGLFELYKNNPQSITKTEISNEEKEKVIKEIKEELEEEDKNNKRGGSWADLQYLLNYDEEKGIPTLKLSYGTIDLPFDLFLQYSKNTHCRNIIGSMVEKQPQKVIEFTKKALGKLGELNAWLVLSPMLGKLNKSQLDKEKVNEIFKEFTAKKYLKGMKISSSMHSSKVKGIASEIINKSPAIAKRFAQEAFDELKTLDVEKDKESIKAIWKILLTDDNFKLIEDLKPALGDLNYHRLGLVLDTHSSYYENNQLRKLLMNASVPAKENGIDEAQKLVNQAFQNNNQNSAHFWELLYLLIMDPEGPKKKSTQIAKQLVEKALKDSNQKFAHFWELLYFLIADPMGPKVNSKEIDQKLVKKALKDGDQNSKYFWRLLYFFTKNKNTLKENLTEIIAKKMTLDTALQGAKDYPKVLTKILQQDKVKTIMEEASKLLIEKGHNKDTREKLHILTNNIKLFSKKDFNLDGLTLEKLAGFYKKRIKFFNFYNIPYKEVYEYKNNINFITEVLTAQKDVVTKMIENGLQEGGEAWKHLQELLDYNKEKGIPTLKLSYKTIDATKMTLDTALQGAKKYPETLMKILEKKKKVAEKLVKEALGKDNSISYTTLLLYILGIKKSKSKIDLNLDINVTNLTKDKVIKWWEKGNSQKKVIQAILSMGSCKEEAKKIANGLFHAAVEPQLVEWEVLKWLIIDSETVKSSSIEVNIFNVEQISKAFSGNHNEIIESVLRSHPDKAKELVERILSNQNLLSFRNILLLSWLIFNSNTNNQGAIVPLANINITIEAAVKIFHYLLNHQNQNLSRILNNVLRNNPLQGEAEKKVNDILNDDTELSKPANIELLHWLIFDSHTNNQQVAIVPLAKIDITPERAIEIFHYLQSRPNQKLSEILNSAIKTQPSIGKGMLEIAINGQKGSSLDWSNANVNFDLLHLLMLDPNGPQLTIEGADLASLDLSAIERHISKPNALELFKKILHDPNNIDTFNAFRYAIFPSNSNSNNTFDYQNVDWDRTKWGSIPALKELIKPIDLPEDIVVKKLQDDGFTHKAIVKDIVLTSSSNLLEKVLNIAFPNVTVTSTTPTPTITWPQSLSATNWDIVASLTDSQHGIIKAKEVIQKVVPGISSSHLNFAKDYDLSSVRWGEFDWEAFEDLAEQSNIASFSIQNYLTIAENVLPGLQFVDQEPQVSQIDWDQIKSYKVVNFLIEKEIIPKKILINAPRSLLKQRINNISRLSLAEADFWKDAQEEKSKYYWSFAPCAVGLVLASAIALYVFNKQTKKQERKRGSHNKEDLKKAAKVKTQHNKDNKQHQKIIGNPIP